MHVNSYQTQQCFTTAFGTNYVRCNSLQYLLSNYCSCHFSRFELDFFCIEVRICINQLILVFCKSYDARMSLNNKKQTFGITIGVPCPQQGNIYVGQEQLNSSSIRIYSKSYKRINNIAISLLLLKFRYSEKATNFLKHLSLCFHVVK